MKNIGKKLKEVGKIFKGTSLKTNLELLATITITLSLIVAGWAVNKRKLTVPRAAAVKVFIVPETADVTNSNETRFDIMVDPGTEQIAGIHAELSFNNKDINLAAGVSSGNALNQEIFTTGMNDANANGKVVIARGLHINDKDNPPTNQFLLATLFFKAVTAGTNLTEILSPEAVKVVNTSSNEITTLEISGTNITINPVATATPTQVPTNTLTPTSVLTPTTSPSNTLTPTTAPTLTPTPTAVPTSSGPITIYPSEDSYVRGDRTTTNYGSLTELNVDGSPETTSYIKFNLSNLLGQTFLSAKLRIRITGSSGSTQNVRETSNDWNELTLTYDNHPALGQTITTFNGGSSGNWVEIDLTSYIFQHRGETISIAIDSQGTDGLDFYSKENSSDKLHLLVQ